MLKLKLFSNRNYLSRAFAIILSNLRENFFHLIIQCTLLLSSFSFSLFLFTSKHSKKYEKKTFKIKKLLSNLKNTKFNSLLHAKQTILKRKTKQKIFFNKINLTIIGEKKTELHEILKVTHK